MLKDIMGIECDGNNFERNSANCTVAESDRWMDQSKGMRSRGVTSGCSFAVILHRCTEQRTQQKLKKVLCLFLETL
jgi:hypothetical protein